MSKKLIPKALSNIVESPFGGLATNIQIMRTSSIIAMYEQKCGIDVYPSFHGVEAIGLYRCEKTGYKFWRPENITGDESFYKSISAAWPNYYRTRRWEHAFAHRFLEGRTSILEIGSGPGHFLKTLEAKTAKAMGIEFNNEAIANKVTQFPIRSMSMEALAVENHDSFDAIYAFQVLEHVSNPCALMKSAMECLAPNGIMMFSTPNNDYISFSEQNDPFDLPPHHIGQFNPVIFKKIGDALGLKTHTIITQKRRFIPSNVTECTRHSVAYKFGLAAAKVFINLSYMVTREPGENILVVYKKV